MRADGEQNPHEEGSLEYELWETRKDVRDLAAAYRTGKRVVWGFVGLVLLFVIGAVIVVADSRNQNDDIEAQQAATEDLVELIFTATCETSNDSRAVLRDNNTRQAEVLIAIYELDPTHDPGIVDQYRSDTAESNRAIGQRDCAAEFANISG